MADLKISQLTGATTPLAGTEVLPIVQSNTTKKVSVDNLTIGKFVRAGSFQADGQIKSTSAAFGASDVIAETTAASGTGYSRFIVKTADREWRFINDASTANSPLIIYDATAAAARMTFNSAGNITFDTGNLVQGTAAKGINFTANTPAAGMTSQLLNWYEQGTWTPTFTNLTTVSGAPAPAGTYTRVGRTVYFTIYIPSGNTTSTANSTYCTNLPFSANGNHVCAASNASTVDSYGNGLIQGANVFTPSWTNKINVIISGTYAV